MHYLREPTLEGTTGMAKSKARRTCPRDFHPTNSTFGVGTNPELDRGCRPNQTKEPPVSYHSIPQKIYVEASAQNDDVGRHVNRAARRNQLQARAEWEEYCLELEIASFPKWKQACELWSHPVWISKRISLAVESRAEVARQQAFAPAMVAPTMAMSLDQPVTQPITIDLPTNILGPEPVSPSSSQDSPQSSQPQTGEHAAELTPDAALVRPIAGLSLPEDLSDPETVVTVVSPRRRASVATENVEDAEASSDATKERARRSSAQ